MCAGQKDSLKNGARCSCPHCSARHRTHTECGFLPYLARSAYASNWNSSPGCAYDCGVFSATCIHIYAALCKCFALQLQSTAVSRLAKKSQHPAKHTLRVFIAKHTMVTRCVVLRYHPPISNLSFCFNSGLSQATAHMVLFPEIAGIWAYKTHFQVFCRHIAHSRKHA